MSRKVRCVVGVCVACLVSLPTAGAGARVPADQKLKIATRVFRELLDLPDREVPQQLLAESACIAVVPSVIKGAFGWGGRHGRGVLTCRDDAAEWSPPIFVTLSGGSFGLQIGAQSTDVVLFFMSERSVRSLLKSKFTLGGDFSVAAGPVGRRAELGTDLRLQAEIYSYAKSRGLFAGISLEGARLAPQRRMTDSYYDARLYAEEVLFGPGVPKLPPEARDFLAALP